MPSLKIEGKEVFYIEQGEEGQVLLLLHGIPVDSSLWEGVIKRIEPSYRVIAPDLIGFGQSSKPLDVTYHMETYVKYVGKFIDQLELKQLIIVGMDLGLMIGLHYFANHPKNVKAIVMFEGMIDDISEVIKRQSFLNRNMIKLFKNDSVAKNAFVKNGMKSIKNMLEAGTITKEVNFDYYVENFQDEGIREKILFEGVSANKIAKAITSGELKSLVHQYSEALKTSSVPKLLLYAKPGAAISEKMVTYALKTIKNLEVECVGNGKHFIPFDQPENMAKCINGFVARLSEMSVNNIETPENV